MKSNGSQALTSAEAEVMNVIWGQFPVAVPEVVDRLARPLAYTTVMTTVRILEQKGFLRQCGKQGRAFLYEPSVPKQEVQQSMLHQLADRLFGGSIKSMVFNMVHDKEIAPDDLAELKDLIGQLEAKQ